MQPQSATTVSVSREAARAKSYRPTQVPPQPCVLPSQALFHPEDDDQRWEPINYEEEEDEMLMWDEGGENVGVPFKLLSNPDLRNSNQ